VPIRFVECRADRVVACERLARRPHETTVSDGRLAILDDFLARFEPMTELPPAEHLVVDTSGDASHALATVRTHLATWPRGLVS
jgi:predicted kinase